jgi:acetylornithine deacetylase/succinyl-diaminopimelate desuccinylase-like protein
VATADSAARDDFEGVEPSGRWVVLLGGVPPDLPPAERLRLQRFATLRHKLRAARARGAVGVLLVDDALAKGRTPFVSPPPADDDLALVAVSREALRRLLAVGKVPSEAVISAMGKAAPARSIPDLALEARISLERETREAHNVIGVLRARGAPAAGPARLPLVIGAHYDHLGTGGGDTTSRERPEEAGEIHPGADDNASGVAAVMELAHFLAARHRAGSLKLERDVVFAAWSAEEVGYVGSRFFVGEPLARRSAAYLNLDMVGRLAGALQVWGVGTSASWNRADRVLSRRSPSLPVRSEPEPDLPTDTYYFYCSGVPVLTFFTGDHDEYHTPRDTAEKLSYDGLERITRFVAEIAEALAGDSEMPAWRDVDADEQPENRLRCP